MVQLSPVPHQPDLLLGASGVHLSIWNVDRRHLLFYGRHDYLHIRDLRCVSPKASLHPTTLTTTQRYLYFKADNADLRQPLHFVGRMARDAVMPTAAVVPLKLMQRGRISSVSMRRPYHSINECTVTAIQGFLLASGTAAGELLLHDVVTGQGLAQLKVGDGSPVNSLVFADAVSLVVGLAGASLAVVDLGRLLPPGSVTVVAAG